MRAEPARPRSVGDFVERIAAGDQRAGARAMRLADDRDPLAFEVLRRLHPRTGRARILGITGNPGSGKSTLVDRLIAKFRGEGRTVGVVAVDPSSPFSGGAILGDRIRMMEHATDRGVFIRSLATRGHLGGLSRSTHDVVSILDAMGFDVILLETVGVGQDEVEVVKLAHTSVVVLVPGMGDDIQAIKAGILEIADVFVVNKADRDGAAKTERELRALQMLDEGRRDWVPPIVRTVASAGQGIDELAEAIERHAALPPDGAAAVERARGRSAHVLASLVEDALSARVEAAFGAGEDRAALLDRLRARETDPWTESERVLARILRRDPP